MGVPRLTRPETGSLLLLQDRRWKRVASGFPVPAGESLMPRLNLAPAAAPSPVAPEERIVALDLLRGFALFGVLLSNLNDWYGTTDPVSYTHLRAHETPEHLVCRLLLEK